MACEYVQTNYLMPLSTVGSDAFIALQTLVWRRATYAAARAAARAYILAHFPANTLAQLTGAERGDLLGLFTAFNANLLFSMVVDSKTPGSAQSLLSRAASKISSIL
jgi:hypothetical protein